MSGQRRQRARRNVEQLEVVGNLQSHVAGQAVRDLVHVHVEHDLRARVPQPFDNSGGGVQHLPRRPDHDGALAGLRSHQAYFKKIAQQIDDVIQFLRRGDARQIESAQRHAIKLAVILHRFRGQQNLLVVERRPEGVSHLAGCGHGGVKVRAADVEPDLA